MQINEAETSVEDFLNALENEEKQAYTYMAAEMMRKVGNPRIKRR